MNSYKKYNDPAVFGERMQETLPEISAVCRALAGNRELAELAMRRGLAEAYFRRSEWLGRLPFAEGIRKTVIAVTLAECAKARPIEIDWQAEWPAEYSDSHSKKMALRLQKESPENLRIIVLYYGADLETKTIATAMGMRRTEVSRIVRHALAGKLQKRDAETALEAVCYDLLMNSDNKNTGVGTQLHIFERDVMENPKKVLPIRKILRWVFGCLGALLLSVTVWLLIILCATA